MISQIKRDFRENVKQCTQPLAQCYLEVKQTCVKENVFFSQSFIKKDFFTMLFFVLQKWCIHLIMQIVYFYSTVGCRFYRLCFVTAFLIRPQDRSFIPISSRVVVRHTSKLVKLVQIYLNIIHRDGALSEI